MNLQLPSDVAAIDRLLIVRLGSMGDIIHTLPAVTALRESLPQAKFGWVVEERWSELLRCLPEGPRGPRSGRRPLVDTLHLVNTKAWRLALTSFPTWKEIGGVMKDLRGEKYQVAIDYQGAARSALIARWSGAPAIYGSSQPRESVASMLYTRLIPLRGKHVIEQALSLSEAVVKTKFKIPPIEFPHDAGAEQHCNKILQQYNLTNFVVMNPGAGWGAKQWPAERYGEVARRLAEWGLGSLINFGPGEGILAQAVEATSDGAAEGISCSLSQLMALTRRAKLFIGGDTGPMHMAAALNVPVVALFGPTNPARNGPFGTRSIVLRSSSSITSHARNRQTEAGLLEITADQVVEAAKNLLGIPCNAKLV